MYNRKNMLIVGGCLVVLLLGIVSFYLHSNNYKDNETISSQPKTILQSIEQNLAKQKGNLEKDLKDSELQGDQVLLGDISNCIAFLEDIQQSLIPLQEIEKLGTKTNEDIKLWNFLTDSLKTKLAEKDIRLQSIQNKKSIKYLEANKLQLTILEGSIESQKGFADKAMNRAKGTFNKALQSKIAEAYDTIAKIQKNAESIQKVFDELNTLILQNANDEQRISVLHKQKDKLIDEINSFVKVLNQQCKIIEGEVNKS